MAKLYLERILDANGDPVSGGRAYIYEAGTTTPVTPYADKALTTAHGVFVTANSAGEFPNTYVFNGEYDIKFTDADETTLYHRNDVLVAESGNANTPERYGAVGDGVADDTVAIANWASDTGALVKAMAPGAVYLCSSLVGSGGVISFPAGSQVSFNGAQIRFNETSSTDTQRMTIGANSRIVGLNLYWTGSNYFKRAVRLESGVTLEDVICEAETDQPEFSDSASDHCLMPAGPNITIRSARMAGLHENIRANSVQDCSNCRITDVTLQRYGSGIVTNGSMTNGIIDGVVAVSKNVNAGPNPGNNAVSNASNGLTVRNVTVFDAAEHGVYLAGTSAVYNVTVENIRVMGSGQCGVKLRYLTDFVVRNVRCGEQHNESAAGTNEDGLRLEDCFNGSIHGFFNGNETGTGGAGYDNIHIDSCSDLEFFDCHVEPTWRSGVYITDVRTSGSVANIVFNGLIAVPIDTMSASENPVIEVVTTGDLGDLEFVNTYARLLSAEIVKINATGAVGRVVVEGDIETQGATYINDVAGGSAVEVQTRQKLIVGSVFREDRVPDADPTRRFLSAAAFDPASADTSASLLLGSNEAATDSGTLGGALVFTKNSSERPWAAIAAYQASADADTGALAFFSKQTISSQDAVQKVAEFTFGGDFEMAQNDKGIVLLSPNGTRYRVTVDNSGNLVTTAL